MKFVAGEQIIVVVVDMPLVIGNSGTFIDHKHSSPDHRVAVVVASLYTGVNKKLNFITWLLLLVATLVITVLRLLHILGWIIRVLLLTHLVVLGSI
jgi:hypothetical protein